MLVSFWVGLVIVSEGSAAILPYLSQLQGHHGENNSLLQITENITRPDHPDSLISDFEHSS